MYICNCYGVRESDVERTIEGGATTLKALRESLGVGSCCGKCVPEVRDRLQRVPAKTAGVACRGCGQCSRRPQPPEFLPDMAPAMC